MSLENYNIVRKNRVYAPLLVALSILIFIFVARPMYGAYSASSSELLSLETQIEQKKSEYAKLQELEKSIQDETSPFASRIEKISQPFHEANILEAVMVNNDFTRKNPQGTSLISLGDVTLSPGTKLPNGLHMGTIHLSIISGSIDNIVGYLTYLTQNAPYAFVLDTITLPLNSTPTSSLENSQVSVSFQVTLGIYYYK